MYKPRLVLRGNKEDHTPGTTGTHVHILSILVLPSV